LTAAAQAAAAKLFATGESLLQAGAAHLFGDWSIADADFALMLNRLVLNGDDVPSQLADYARRQWQRDAIQAWLELGRRTRI
jgi:glutathione S-transferase